MDTLLTLVSPLTCITIQEEQKLSESYPLSFLSSRSKGILSGQHSPVSIVHITHGNQRFLSHPVKIPLLICSNLYDLCSNYICYFSFNWSQQTKSVVVFLLHLLLASLSLQTSYEHTHHTHHLHQTCFSIYTLFTLPHF